MNVINIRKDALSFGFPCCRKDCNGVTFSNTEAVCTRDNSMCRVNGTKFGEGGVFGVSDDLTIVHILLVSPGNAYRGDEV